MEINVLPPLSQKARSGMATLPPGVAEQGLARESDLQTRELIVKHTGSSQADASEVVY